jgi:hypothetical protein
VSYSGHHYREHKHSSKMLITVRRTRLYPEWRRGATGASGQEDNRAANTRRFNLRVTRGRGVKRYRTASSQKASRCWRIQLWRENS